MSFQKYFYRVTFSFYPTISPSLTNGVRIIIESKASARHSSNVRSGPGLTHKNGRDYRIEMYGLMYVRILTIGMGVLDMYLVLCAALQLLSLIHI